MNNIGSLGGIPRWAALVGWGMAFVCVCLAAYEFVHPGGLALSGRTEALFLWAKESFGPRGVAWVPNENGEFDSWVESESAVDRFFVEAGREVSCQSA